MIKGAGIMAQILGEVQITAVFAAIAREREYQDRKWGPVDGPGSRHIAEYLLILRQELAEAEKGWVKGKGDVEALREILQVAAVAVACLQQHGIVEREGLP
jgi:hypothetical protein